MVAFRSNRLSVANTIALKFNKVFKILPGFFYNISASRLHVLKHVEPATSELLRVCFTFLMKIQANMRIGAKTKVIIHNIVFQAVYGLLVRLVRIAGSWGIIIICGGSRVIGKQGDFPSLQFKMIENATKKLFIQVILS